MSNAEKFINLFNQLERHLNSLSSSTEHFGFRRLVDTLSKTNDTVSEYKYDLIEFLELRNAIVHKSTGEPIAEPDTKVLVQLEKILSEFTQPQTAIDIASKPVYTCETKTPVVDVLEKMSTRSYTSIPVYLDNHFVGVFSDRCIVDWLETQARQHSISLENKTVGELQAFFHDKDSKFHSYRFIARDTTAPAVRAAFTSFLSEEKLLAALFVTATGSDQEPIEGIITAWDLPRFNQPTKRAESE